MMALASVELMGTASSASASRPSVFSPPELRPAGKPEPVVPFRTAWHLVRGYPRMATMFTRNGRVRVREERAQTDARTCQP